MKTANILLLDEDKEKRGAISEILGSGGYRVVEAEHHDHAVQLLAAEPFDLLLLNLTFPDSKGFTLLEHLHVNKIGGKVIVLIGSTERPLSGDRSSREVLEHRLPRYHPASLLKSVEHALADGAPATFNIHIVNGGDFIRGTPTGVLDMQTSREGLAKIAKAGVGLHGYTVLIDLREATARLSTADVYELAKELGTFGETFRRKTAVLTRVDGHIEQARFFETVAQNGGFRVRAFTVFEEAVTWLSTVATVVEVPSVMPPEPPTEDHGRRPTQ